MRTSLDKNQVRGWKNNSQVASDSDNLLRAKPFNGEMNRLKRFIVIVACMLGATTGFSKSWEQSISEVEAKVDEMWTHARSQENYMYLLGTMHNELDAQKHECAILGRILDRIEYVREIEHLALPELKEPMSEDELYELQLAARSLGNWAFTARRALNMTKYEQSATWNLDCVGAFGIPVDASVKEEVLEAKFRVEGRTLYVLGDIDPGFAEDLAGFVAQNTDIDTVALGSAGGSVSDAIKAGMMIRSLGLNTTLTNNCLSACTFVFLGGVERQIWSPYPKLGFHQMYVKDSGALLPIDDSYRVIRKYAQVMGVDPKFVLAAMLSAEPKDMYYPQLSELCESGTATWVQRICWN